MNWQEMNEAYLEAMRTMEKADNYADSMARMLTGRLRKVSTYNLDRLKKELRDYNIHTGAWKS